MTYTTFDPEQTMRDLRHAWTHHPDRRPLDVLRERKRQRGEWRVPSPKVDLGESNG